MRNINRFPGYKYERDDEHDYTYADPGMHEPTPILDIPYLSARFAKVTVKDVSKLLHKSPSWIRCGIIAGWLPIGIATRKGQIVESTDEIGKGRITYTIYPEQLYSFVDAKITEDLYEGVIEKK